MGIGKDLCELMLQLDYNFKDISLLETALTHSSYSNEMRKRGYRATSNEALEFLGDAVLELVISEELYKRLSKDGEGALTKVRQALVCEASLSAVATRLSLGDYLHVGSSEEATGVRNRQKVLADSFEALIAAIYIDDECDGHKNLRRLILKLFEAEIDNALVRGNNDYKSMLQQFVEKNPGDILTYVCEETGPEHSKTFAVTAYINNNRVGVGVGKTKRGAEQSAACAALKLFGIS